MKRATIFNARRHVGSNCRNKISREGVDRYRRENHARARHTSRSRIVLPLWVAKHRRCRRWQSPSEHRAAIFPTERATMAQQEIADDNQVPDMVAVVEAVVRTGSPGTMSSPNHSRSLQLPRGSDAPASRHSLRQHRAPQLATQCCKLGPPKLTNCERRTSSKANRN